MQTQGEIRNPKIATSDFEQSLRLALIQVWPEITRVGCFFHQNQAIRRQAKTDGLLSSHYENISVRHQIVLMYMRLGLLPLEQINDGIKAIENTIDENNLTKDFANFKKYFHSTWIIRYPKSDWCVSERQRRTNNNTEGHNNRIKLLIPRNPTPWDFLQCLLDLSIEATAKLDSDIKSNAPPPKDRSKLSEPLKQALNALNDGRINVLEFLKSMAAIH